MIKYDIQHLSNAQGRGISRPCVQLALPHLSPNAEIKEMAGRNTPLTRVDMRVELSVVVEFVESQLATENILSLKKTALFLCCYFPLHYLCNATASLHN